MSKITLGVQEVTGSNPVAPILSPGGAKKSSRRAEKVERRAEKPLPALVRSTFSSLLSLPDRKVVRAVSTARGVSTFSALLVDEISSDSFPSGHTSRRPGVGIKRNDGTVTIKPDRRPESCRRPLIL